MTDINLLGFKWCCSGDCGCDGGEHEVSGVATWEGYSRWVYSWVRCLCSSGNYPDEEEAHAVNLSLSVPRVIFTNDDGTAELPDLAPLKIEFSSTQETNGVIVLTHYKDLDAVRIWADSNKTDLVLGTFVWEIKNQSSGVTNLYVEGTHVSKNHQSVNFNLTWCDELLGDEKISINRKTTVYYPIANVINNTLWDNGRLCNPSGIIVGSNACFAVEFPKLEPPAEDIKWSIVEGPAAFVGGDRGSKVYVTATEPNQAVKLRAQVGDSVSRPIEFTAFTVDPLNVKLTVWIVRDDRGGYAARNPVEVTNMVAEVNRIYEQIGVSFYVDSISYTNKRDWLDLRLAGDIFEREDYNERRNLVNMEKDSGGLELYFINQISRSAYADHDVFGIVLSTNATAKVLAHEIGHAFGCTDIYHEKKKNNVLIKIQNEVLCKDKAFYDWNNGSGARYYNPKKNHLNLICTLLMCGYSFPYVGDLSFGSIYGLTSRGEESLVDVGFFRGGVRRTIRFHQ